MDPYFEDQKVKISSAYFICDKSEKKNDRGSITHSEWVETLFVMVQNFPQANVLATELDWYVDNSPNTISTIFVKVSVFFLKKGLKCEC